MADKIHQPFLVDTVTKEVLFFQSIPTEVEINPEPNWVALAAPGRNNPLYQYAGGEDSVEFELTWYANEEGKQDVLKKCKWLESLTKNDGYDNPPHPVILVFGNLFKQSKWIVYSAPYKIGLFDRPLGMMPSYASQRIILKRVTELNRSRADVLNLET